MRINPFNSPHDCRKQLLDSTVMPDYSGRFQGKGILYLFLTRFCGVGCPFCFFRSKPSYRSKNIEDSFSYEGVSKLIDFANRANLGYVMISGGGEPLNEKESVLRLVEHVTSDRIVMATSGNWAANRKVGEAYVDALYKAFKRRKTPTTVVIRISISEGHAIRLGKKPALNLIDIFRKKYAKEAHFKFQVHAFENDQQLDRVMASLEDATIRYVGSDISDNQVVKKVIPHKHLVSFPEGYEFVVGVSRIFHSNLDVDLNCHDNLLKATKVFELDLIHSEGNNSAVVENYDGTTGIDWAVNYNGNVYTWQNQVNDNLLNLYEDDYTKILHESFKDPLVVAYMLNDRRYRENIVSEVNPKAVDRTKGIAIRDFSGSIIFEEWKDRLYFSIRALQDMRDKGQLDEELNKTWPERIKRLVALSKQDLISAYHSADFCILDQYKIDLEKSEEEWLDLFMLIDRGHFKVSEQQLSKGIAHFNLKFDKQLLSIKEIKVNEPSLVRRLTERYMHIKPSLKGLGEGIAVDVA